MFDMLSGTCYHVKTDRAAVFLEDRTAKHHKKNYVYLFEDFDLLKFQQVIWYFLKRHPGMDVVNFTYYNRNVD